MAPTVITGQRATAGTQAIEQSGRKPDRAVTVALLEPNEAPLLRLTDKLSKRRAINPEYDWFEDEPFPYWGSINAGAGYTAGDTSIVVDVGGYFAANYLVHVPRTGETMLVTSVSTHTLTVTREITGTAVALVDGDDLRIIGTAYAEGASSGTMKSTKKAKVYNYTQIFRDPFGATGTEEASELYWGKDRAEERRSWGVDHAIRLESAFMFGERSEDTSGATARRTTRGLINSISTNSTAINGFLSIDTWDAWIRDGTRYSSRTGKNLKWVFGSRLACGAVNGFARDVLQTVPKDQLYGINAKEYQNLHGRVFLIPHFLLENNPLTAGNQDAVYGGYMVMVDPESPKMRFLQGRDTKLKRDIQARDVDGWKDEYLSEVGFQLEQERWNSLATGITG